MAGFAEAIPWMKKNLLFKFLFPFVVVIALPGCGGLGLDSGSTDSRPTDFNDLDNTDITNSLDPDSPTVATVKGKLEVAEGEDASAIQSAKVEVIGQEEYSVSTDSEGNFTLLIDTEKVTVDSAISDPEATIAVIAGSSKQSYEPSGVDVGLLVVSASEDYGVKLDTTVTESETLDLSPIRISKVGAITGNATLEGETDHAGIMVYIPGTSFIAKTDSDGNFTISNIPNGTYQHLRAEADGFNDAILSDIAVVDSALLEVADLELLLNTGTEGVLQISGGADISSYQTVTLTVSTSGKSALMAVSESEMFLNAKWVPMQSTYEYTFDSDGEKTLYMMLADANGLNSLPFSDSIFVDSTPTVVLQSPVLNTGSTLPTFLWDASPLPNATYHFQLASDSTYGTIIEDATNVAETSYNLETALSDSVTYYWRVSIIDEEEVEWGWAESSFTVDLGTVSLLTPANGTVLTTLSPTFVWDSNDLAVSYIFELSTNSDMSDPLETQTGLIGTGTAIATDLVFGDTATYYWAVTHVDENGVSGTRSNIFSFTLDTTTPIVTSMSPAEGSGRIPVDTSISINLSEPLNPDTVLADSISVDNGVTGTVSLSNGNRTVTFTPSAPLPRGTTYTVTINSGMQDVIGYSLAGSSWSFSTRANWQTVSAGWEYTLAIKSDGTLWGWGNNDFGQLGNGAVSSSASPVQVGTDSDWVSVDAGSYHALAIKSGRTLWAWGKNEFGQLGAISSETCTTNVENCSTTPLKVGTDTDWLSIGAGGEHTFALKTGGTIWGWGKKGNASLGNLWTGEMCGWNSLYSCVTTPKQFGTDTDWSAISVGDQHNFGIKTGGTLWAWGDGGSGELGHGSTGNLLSATQIGTDNDWKTVSAGTWNTEAIKTDGTLWGWGYNRNAYVGDGTTVTRLVPVQIGTDTDWITVSVGTSETTALKSDGTLWGWGAFMNSYVDGVDSKLLSPIQLNVDTDWVFIGSGYDHFSALKNDNSLWLWGRSDDGQSGVSEWKKILSNEFPW